MVGKYVTEECQETFFFIDYLYELGAVIAFLVFVTNIIKHFFGAYSNVKTDRTNFIILLDIHKNTRK